MNRLSFSRQPTAYVAVVAALIVVLTTLGLDVPKGLEAAVDGLIVAVAGAVTWTQVRPAAHSVSNAEALRQAAETAAAVRAEYGDPTEVRAKSAADLARPDPRVGAGTERDMAFARPAKKAKKAAKKPGK